MKINEKVYNGLIVGICCIVAVLAIGAAFGFVPSANMDTVVDWINRLGGTVAGLLCIKGE